MRASRLTSILASGAALAVLAGGMAAAATTGTTSSPSGAGATDDTVLAERLAFNREEERLARDLYTYFADRYDNDRPFAMIARSEQQHFRAVGTLLTTYDVPDPSAGLAPGTYADPDLQQLYDTWKAEGRVSLEEAYRVGQALEERDIADLEATLTELTETDVQTVLGHLLTASRQHLRAFTAALGGDPAGPLQMGPGRGPGAGPGWGRMGPGNREPGRLGGGFRGPGAGSGDCPMLGSTS